MTSSTPSPNTQKINEIIARVRSDVALLRQVAIEPVDIPYGEGVSFEIRPNDEGDRLNVYRKDWGTTCVNYTGEGLILDVYSEGAMDTLHTTSIESAELVDTDQESGGYGRVTGAGTGSNQEKLDVLSSVGYQVSEDPVHRGLWFWTYGPRSPSCNWSLEKHHEAIEDAWRDAGVRVATAEEVSWNGRTFKQQAELIKTVLGADPEDSPSQASAPTPTGA